MMVYLDNSATTRPRDEVIEEMNYMLKTCYGNPSSLHHLGFQAEKKVEEARKAIGNFLRVRNDEIYFTSGGTESNNIAIQGLINKYSRQGNHIITTKIEHSSVLNIMKHYEEKGFNITYLDVNEEGFIDLKQFEECLDDSTILVSIMLVNNEIGTIEPITQVREIMNKKNSKALLHVDGIQAFGKISLDLAKWNVDTFSFSGHKIYGPKGIGGLYVKKNVLLKPIIFGGNQEEGLRSGTENVPGIVGMGKAVEIIDSNFESESKAVFQLKRYFIERIKEEIPNIRVNSLIDDRFSPYIVNISFLNTRGEVLLHYLENKGIYVSTASACSSHGKGKSHVLQAIGRNDNEMEGTLRFSFSYSNTKEEIDYVVEELKKSIDEIRKITMR